MGWIESVAREIVLHDLVPVTDKKTAKAELGEPRRSDVSAGDKDKAA